MQRLEVSGVVRPIYGSSGVKRLINKLACLLTAADSTVDFVGMSDDTKSLPLPLHARSGPAGELW